MLSRFAQTRVVHMRRKKSLSDVSTNGTQKLLRLRRHDIEKPWRATPDSTEVMTGFMECAICCQATSTSELCQLSTAAFPGNVKSQLVLHFGHDGREFWCCHCINLCENVWSVLGNNTSLPNQRFIISNLLLLRRDLSFDIEYKTYAMAGDARTYRAKIESVECNGQRHDIPVVQTFTGGDNTPFGYLALDNVAWYYSLELLYRHNNKAHFMLDRRAMLLKEQLRRRLIGHVDSVSDAMLVWYTRGYFSAGFKLSESQLEALSQRHPTVLQMKQTQKGCTNANALLKYFTKSHSETRLKDQGYMSSIMMSFILSTNFASQDLQAIVWEALKHSPITSWGAARVVNSLLAEISCKRLRDYAPQGLQCITHVRKKSNTYRDSRVLMACVIVLNSSRFGQFIQQTLRSAGMFWQSPITLSFIGCEIRKYFFPNSGTM